MSSWPTRKASPAVRVISTSPLARVTCTRVLGGWWEFHSAAGIPAGWGGAVAPTESVEQSGHGLPRARPLLDSTADLLERLVAA